MSEVTARIPVTVDGTVKWNPFKYFLHPTPEFASQIFNAFLAVAAAATIFVEVMPVPPAVKNLVVLYSVPAVTFVRLFCKSFGIKIKDVEVTK